MEAEVEAEADVEMIVELSNNIKTKTIIYMILMEEDEEATNQIDQDQQTSLMSNATDVIGTDIINMNVVLI